MRLTVNNLQEDGEMFDAIKKSENDNHFILPFTLLFSAAKMRFRRDKIESDLAKRASFSLARAVYKLYAALPRTRGVSPLKM